MDYCGPQGIPYSRFLDWDPMSRDAALAWQARQNATCGGCGQVTAEWMTIDGDGEPVELRPAPMMVATSFCPACDTLERARESRSKDTPASQRLAFVPISPKPDEPAG